MIPLNEFINKENISNEISDKIAFSLSCWVKSFKVIPLYYELPKIFESAGQFNNCGKVVKEVINYLWDNKNKYNYSHIFNCKEFDVFFDKLIINVYKYSSTYGIYDKFENSTVYIDLYIGKTNNDLSNFSNDLEYTVVHELIHAYIDYNRKSKGLQGINALMQDKNYALTYRSALKYIHIDKFYKDNYKESDTEYLTRLVSKYRYFLDNEESKAYLGTVKSCVHKITKKVGPTFRSLKFDKVIELFKNEYIWKDYLDIYIFIKNIEDINNQALQSVYDYFFR